jgi:hypothetical protein
MLLPQQKGFEAPRHCTAVVTITKKGCRVGMPKREHDRAPVRMVQIDSPREWCNQPSAQLVVYNNTKEWWLPLCAGT